MIRRVRCGSRGTRKRSSARFYDHTEVELAAAWVAEIGRDFTDESTPFEARLNRTIRKWAAQIVAWHQSNVSNGPTEAINNLVKRVERTAFGFRRFEHYRIRALLYAGPPSGHSSTNSPHREIRSATITRGWSLTPTPRDGTYLRSSCGVPCRHVSARATKCERHFDQSLTLCAQGNR